MSQNINSFSIRCYFLITFIIKKYKYIIFFFIINEYILMQNLLNIFSLLNNSAQAQKNKKISSSLGIRISGINKISYIWYNIILPV